MLGNTGNGQSNVRTFESARFGQIRTAQGANCEPLFCLADVCKVLGLQTNKVKQRINSRGWNSIPTPTYNQHGALVIQEMTFIDEPNLYRCIFQSRKDEAELFQSWVCEEVLPAIRQTGGYIASHANDTPELIMARALQVAQDTIQRHQQQLQIVEGERDKYLEEVKVLAPKASYTDEVLQSTSTYTFTQVSKDLGLRSVHKLTALLHERGIIYKQSNTWMPTAKYSECGYFDTRTHKFIKDKETNEIGSSMTTVITERGRQFIHTLVEGN